MRFEERIPEDLFEGDGHYRGRPADFSDKFVHVRVKLTRAFEGFIGKNYELLDIGCGNGATMFLLADEFKSLDGLELEKNHKEEFERYKEKHKIGNCNFRLFNVEEEKIEKQYDRILSFEVIEHLRDEKSVKHYFNALKPGGMAAFTVPYKWWIFETHGANLPLLPWNRVPFFSWLPKPIHERYANARIYTKKRIRKLLTEAGFEVGKITNITAPLDVLKDSKTKRFFQKYILKNDTTKVPFFTPSIFIEARKPE